MSTLLTLATFGLDAKGRKERMQRAADILIAEWGAEASAHMGSRSARAYRQSLVISEVTDTHAVVSLGDPKARVSAKAARLAMMLEHGLGPGGIGSEGPFDIRQNVLKAGTRRLRQGKRGKYVNVPFKLSAGDIERMGGSATRRAVQSAGFKHTTQNQHKTLYGGRLNAGHAAKLKSHHTTDPLHGLLKFGSRYRGGRIQTSGFGTFRRMSEQGKPWIHPGIKARKIAEKVSKMLPKLLEGLL